MLKMEQMKYLQVPGWEHFTPPDVNPVECACKLTNGYVRNNNNKSNNNNINNSSTSSSNIALTINGRCCCDINTMNANDKYTAAIELSNKCREFYNSRLEAANNIKSRWRVTSCDKLATENSLSSPSLLTHSPQALSSSSSSSTSSSSSSSESLSSTSSLSASSGNGVSKDNDNNNSSEPCKTRRHNSIDLAMDRLRTEMMSLMEQDLSLMKQLLTLNETIEELKWQRQYYSCSTSCASLSPSGHFQCRAGDGGSAWSVSDTEMYESEDDLRLPAAAAVRSDGSEATATAAVTPAGATQTTASSSGTPTPMSSSSASLAMVQHHIQPPTTGHVTGPTWHSTRKARKASRESDRVSLDSLSLRLGHADEGEGGLAAEVQAALRKMENSAGKKGDCSIFPIAFVDSNRSLSALATVQNNQKDGIQKREAMSHTVTPQSSVPSMKTFKLTSDHLDLTPGPIIRHDRDQHSFDSGIHEPALSEEIVWNV